MKLMDPQRKWLKKCHNLGAGTGNCWPGQPGETGLEGMRCFSLDMLGETVQIVSKRRRHFFSAEQQPSHSRMQSHLGVRRQGHVESQEVHDNLLDTGCTWTILHKELVPPPEKFLEEGAVTIQCSHGKTVLYPLAKQVDGLEIEWR